MNRLHPRLLVQAKPTAQTAWYGNQVSRTTGLNNHTLLLAWHTVTQTLI